MVMRLTKYVRDKYHKLFFDNLFTSIDLLIALESEKILASETIRANRLAVSENNLFT